MSFYKTNDCVGCPQGCISCGRNIDYIVLECDECGNESSVLYEYDNMQLCEDCLKKQFNKITEEDLNDLI